MESIVEAKSEMEIYWVSRCPRKSLMDLNPWIVGEVRRSIYGEVPRLSMEPGAGQRMLELSAGNCS